MEKKKVLLGMSGGVDSSVSALLLKEQGYEVIGTTLELFAGSSCCNVTTYLDAKHVCNALGIPHFTYDCKTDFRKYIIDDFIECYANCKTPNPCIECNKYMKFGFMYEKAKELGCYYIATGHYAKTEYSETYRRWVLKKSKAGKKDQSYVLWNMPKELMEHVVFPLADFESKEEIREIARKKKLKVANKPDSEDICFVPDGNYKKFLENNSEIKPKKGNIVNTKGEILGKHTGLYNYTIGQRKGLGISYSVPLFVLGFNKTKNEVIVGEEKELYRKEFMVTDINLLLVDEIKDWMEVEVKTRYSSKVAKAKIKQEEGNIRVRLDEPQRAITPGQSAVFYVGDIVLRRRKNNMLNQFSRTELLIGKEGIEKLQNAKVAIFGIGGVGSFVVEGLVRAGIGNFILVDDDKICLTNLNRQIIATRKTIGKPKVEVARDRILEINPNAKVEIIQEFFMPDSKEFLDDTVDYVVDAVDTVTAKIELVVRTNKLQIPIISSMGTGNKLDPTRFEVTDIYQTSICPLAKVMRKELRARGIKELKVVYSKEEPIKPDESLACSCKNGCICPPGTVRKCTARNQVPGSISFVPSVVGLIVAGEVIKDILKK